MLFLGICGGIMFIIGLGYFCISPMIKKDTSAFKKTAVICLVVGMLLVIMMGMTERKPRRIYNGVDYDKIIEDYREKYSR